MLEIENERIEIKFFLMRNLKQNPQVVNLYHIGISFRDYFKFKPILFIRQYFSYLNELNSFKKMGENTKFRHIQLYPRLSDKTDNTPIEPIYFFQDTWAAKKIFEMKPSHHYDIGSSVKTVGIISQFVPTTMVDIRPLEIELPDLFFIKGDILNLPFEDSSIESLSSLCVVEHIGLGRYGDALNPFGSEEAIQELKRVLKPGGFLLFSVPVDKENKIYFNAHRTFTREYILSLFSDMMLMEEKYIYKNKLYDCYDPKKGFGTGLYLIKK
jgi:SAM-dependent methyltransferase